MQGKTRCPRLVLGGKRGVLNAASVPSSSSVCVKSLQLCLTLCDPWTVPYWAPLSMGFSKQEYWSRSLFPPPWGLPDSGIELTSLMSPALAGGSLPPASPGKPQELYQSF